MLYSLRQGVVFREIDGDYIAYSGQSGETSLLHEYAFKILACLAQPLSYQELYDKLISEVLNDGSGIDLDVFLRETLHQLTGFGFIDVSTATPINLIK